MRPILLLTVTVIVVFWFLATLAVILLWHSPTQLADRYTPRTHHTRLEAAPAIEHPERQAPGFRVAPGLIGLLVLITA